MRSPSSLYGTLGLIALLTLAEVSKAQTPEQRPVPLPALGRSLVSNGDTSAMVQNPANLAFLDGPEFRWSGYFLGETARVPSAGHALAFAFPLGFIPFTTGLRFDLVHPNAVTAREMLDARFSYQWLTWSLATGSDAASLGISFQRSYSDRADLHGFGTWTIGGTLRPLDHLGVAGTVRQVDAPESEGGLRLDTSYDMGLVLRPTGTSALELGAEALYVDEDGGYWVPRATLDVGIPGLGRLRGDVAVKDPGQDVGETSWVASTALVVNGNGRTGSAELSLGTRYGSGLGAASSERPYENVHVDLAVRGFRETHAADNLAYGLRVRIEDTPDTRDHTALLRRLWEMAEEEANLRAVLLEIRAEPADSLAHLQELKDAISLLRERGKKVLCHIEDGGGGALYACASADKILLNPAGSLRFSGLKSESFYLKGLLDKLGIRGDFVRIGEHKAAPETFVREESSETAKRDRSELLQAVEMELSSQIASGRKLSVEELRSVTRQGPFTAAEAKQNALVDGFAFDDMLEAKLDELAGESLVLEEGSFGPVKSDHFGPERRLALIYVDGDMVDGRSQTFPFVGIHTVGSYTIAESLRQVREDKSVGAVVLRIETGGGSAMAADVIWREVQLTAAKKPVVVSMGTAAASGGYYIAAPGSYIYANPLTMTGSIGVFYGKIDIASLLNKIGVNVETLKTTPHADAEGMFRPYTEEERNILKQKIEQFYGLFLERVKSGRGLARADIDKVGRGRVWTGRQAKSHRLVDELGGLRQALAKARVLGDLRDDAPILELPIPETSLIGKLLGIEGLSTQATPPLPKAVHDFVRVLAPYALYSSDAPLARVEQLPTFRF